MLRTCYGEVAKWLRTCYGETGVMDFGLWRPPIARTNKVWTRSLQLDRPTYEAWWLSVFCAFNERRRCAEASSWRLRPCGTVDNRNCRHVASCIPAIRPTTAQTASGHLRLARLDGREWEFTTSIIWRPLCGLPVRQAAGLRRWKAETWRTQLGVIMQLKRSRRPSYFSS